MGLTPQNSLIQYSDQPIVLTPQNSLIQYSDQPMGLTPQNSLIQSSDKPDKEICVVIKKHFGKYYITGECTCSNAKIGNEWFLFP